MKKLVLGMLAHVDAGKTTLTEGMLYESGSIRRMGRVDNKDTFLDTYALEKERGITIFAKQAVMEWEHSSITLLDTPGHVDFSAEMERTLQVLDYAILVISALDGVQAHTQTLWGLLKKYRIPVFLFINKMDQAGACKENILEGLKRELDWRCIDFTVFSEKEELGSKQKDSFQEEIAMTDETLLSGYLETGQIIEEKVQKQILDRRLFPCFFGSALRVEGVRECIEGMDRLMSQSFYDDTFAARVFKVVRDEQGMRLTHLKVTGGSLRVKQILEPSGEKINQIRVYSGSKYETVQIAQAGTVCAVTGVEKTLPGEGIGAESAEIKPVLTPVLCYKIILPSECEVAQMLPKLRMLEEEEPLLHIVWKEDVQEIQAQIMGEMQIEILKSLIQERFHISVTFDAGSVVYQESITNASIGIGHFEPLRHYAEVQVLLEPLQAGSGIEIECECSEEILGKNWQNLIMTHLREKEHRGVMIGAPITDLRITLVAGRAHLKHTEGGDFREAAYRAVRQGLMYAESVLLEPYYEFVLEVPERTIGRVMYDLEKMAAVFSLPETTDGKVRISGIAPAAKLIPYQTEIVSFTSGEGRVNCRLKGYFPCHNAKEVLENRSYDANRDGANPTGSIFCSHGAGFYVPWDEVNAHKHVNYETKQLQPMIEEQIEVLQANQSTRQTDAEQWIGNDEVDKILAQTYYANSEKKKSPYKKSAARVSYEFSDRTMGTSKSYVKREPYLLVDGYNIIFAWEELKELAKDNLEGARGRLLDILCNYQAMTGGELIVVFDAYRVVGHKAEIMDYHNIHLVFTKEAETADNYIEKFAHQNNAKYDITVATSDALEQIIIRGQGCRIVSARDLQEDVNRVKEILQENYLKE